MSSISSLFHKNSPLLCQVEKDTEVMERKKFKKMSPADWNKYTASMSKALGELEKREKQTKENQEAEKALENLKKQKVKGRNDDNEPALGYDEIETPNNDDLNDDFSHLESLMTAEESGDQELSNDTTKSKETKKPKGEKKPYVPPTEIQYEEYIRSNLNFLSYVPIMFVSATTGFSVPSLLDTAVESFYEREKRLKTSDLLKIIRHATMKHHLPQKGKHKLTIRFAAQADLYPPTFVFFVNNPDAVPRNYQKFMENCIRETHPFTGTPIRVVFRKNSNKYVDEKNKKDKEK